MSDLFARVRPLVGETLQERRVAVLGSPMAGEVAAEVAREVVEYLAACGVRRWVVLAENKWMGPVVATLRRRFGDEIDITISVADATLEGAADLVLVVDDWALACGLPRTVPRLAIFTPRPGQPSQATFAMAGETLEGEEEVTATPADDSHLAIFHEAGWEWRTAAPLMALCARALLLRDTAYAMATWEDAWARGMRTYAVGGAHDPTCATWQARKTTIAPTTYYSPPARRGTLLIAGLGSLGSVAACHLAPYIERLVLVDPDRVEVENLVRQQYAHCQVGMAKANALAQTLQGGRVSAAATPAISPVITALTDDEQVAALIRAEGVTAALVTTGSHADFAIARAARAAAIPHVVGRCYARARFWEGIVVDAPVGDGELGSSYDQVRRGVTLGPTPAPTPEEVAAYGAVGELAGEPATAMETGWAALWLARLTAQMILPMALREGWLLARLAAGATCFVGGVVVEAGAVGAAYGVRVPGEVHAWSTEEIG